VAVIIGDGPEFEAVKSKRDALGLHDRVLLPGHQDDASSFCSAFDIFVLPSRKEGMPWTVLEAMAAKLSVIATDVGACRWMLKDSGDGEAGIVVPKEDPIAIADAMRDLKNDAARRERLSIAARATVQRRFTWNATFAGNRDALDAR